MRLTPREREVALLVAEGLDDVTIARRLEITTKTVTNYVRRVQWRLHLGSREELIAWVAARSTPDHPEDGLHRRETGE